VRALFLQFPSPVFEWRKFIAIDPALGRHMSNFI
jgi:hypothetical protein